MMIFVQKLVRPLLLLCFFMPCGPAFAQMHPLPGESKLEFDIKNFGFKSGGRFDPPEGDIIFNPGDLSKSSFKMTVKSASVNTDNNSRDEHLRGEDYFDVQKYSQIRFESTSVRLKSGNEYLMTGNLTIRDKTHEISFPFTAEKKGNGFLFTGSFKMNRRDFNVGGSSTLSNELTVRLQVLAQ